MKVLPKETREHWASVAPIFSIRGEREYDRAVKQLNQLLDEIGDNQRHPLYTLLDTLGIVIHAYEETHHRIPKISGRDMLRHLMNEHGVNQSELPEIGSQGVVSEILSGKRELNRRQIIALGKRFGVSPTVFL
jgi:HTH-type transcriptional regulator / antitoxin HigA